MADEKDQVFHSPENSAEKGEEEAKLGLLRNLVENKDSAAKGIDDEMLRRFLRARDLHVEKACLMLLKYLKWRQTFVPGGSFCASEIPNELAQNKMFMQGVDRKGRPIAFVFGARHFAGKGDEFKRFLVFVLDKLCSRIPDGEDKFMVIGDLKGYTYSNSDVRGYLAALKILQDYYPERLGKVLVIHAPQIFMTLWKIIYPFIDKTTRSKIVFVDERKQKQVLLEDIEESQLPEMYGGKLPLRPIQDCSP